MLNDLMGLSLMDLQLVGLIHNWVNTLDNGLEVIVLHELSDPITDPVLFTS